jgi:hypothetical protein
MRTLAIAALVLCASAPALAQSSASYKLNENALDFGGNPLQGSTLASAQYRITFDAIGGPVAQSGLASASHRMDVGFVAPYRPPGEVLGLAFASKSSLTWTPERSIGTYDFYRNTIVSLPGDFGSCFAGQLTTEGITDPTIPSAGTGFFYLVAARNRLGEHGTKGYRSGGVERSNPSPCP